MATTKPGPKLVKAGTWNTAQEFPDDMVSIVGSVDATKKVVFQVDGLTTGTTRTITIPDADLEVQPTAEVQSGNFTARNHGSYIVVATATVTDPTPVEGHEFTVLVRNGTATVGGTAYATAGTLVVRSFHSGAWTNHVYPHLSGAWTWTAQQTFSAITAVSNTTASTDLGIGAFTVAGGASFAENVNLGGYIRIRGNAAAEISAQPTSVTGGQASTFNVGARRYDANGQGLVSYIQFRGIDGSGNQTNGAMDFYLRPNSAGGVEAAENVATWTAGNSVLGGTLALLQTTASTSSTTGAFTCSGGGGFAKAIYAGEAILSTGATHGVGYGTGAGGTVTQITSRTTGVTVNKVCGEITLVSAAGSAAWQSFTVTNSAVAATDRIIVNQKSGTDLYMIHVTALAAGSFRITYATTGGTTSEQPVFGFTVIKSVAA